MRVLLFRMSSLGDIVHMLPAVIDAHNNIANLELTWVVEENFIPLVELHPFYPQKIKILPIAMRRWRKNLIKTWQSRQWHDFKQQLQQDKYDVIIDAQGLIKTAILGKMAHGKLVGLNKECVRETLACRFYKQTYAVDKSTHISERNRSLVAAALGYAKEQTPVNYGFALNIAMQNHVTLLHGTTWPSKHYPEPYWRQVVEFLNDAHIQVKIPWGNQHEYERAMRLAQNLSYVEVLPKLSIPEVSQIIAASRLCLGLDSGLAHLAGALNVPCISLYGPTNPKLIGAYGQNQVHLCANTPWFGKSNHQQICLDKLPAEDVITAISKELDL